MRQFLCMCSCVCACACVCEDVNIGLGEEATEGDSGNKTKQKARDEAVWNETEAKEGALKGIIVEIWTGLLLRCQKLAKSPW